ncbi:MAG: DUF4760 domain-containing protein [Desulfobacteraceae bacterium]|nr:MAG: DUF4760 domain-containing protein [Desulfobacteraceae bacterium]
METTLLSKLQLDYFESLTNLKIDPHKTALSEEEAMLIHSDNSAFIATTAYLNNIENICAAVEIGSVDEDCAYAVHANGVLRSYYKFKTFIDYLRKKLSDDEIYIEIEKVACKWGEMDSCTIKKREKMKKPEPSKKGAQKKV